MRKLILLAVPLAIVACSTAIEQKSFKLSDGKTVDYVTGKVAGDGQEANFRDAFIDGKPVLSHYGSGQSLTGQVLQGAASSALIAGGMVGSAAVLRPTRINHNETNNLNNDQDQLQLQGQEQDATAVSVSESTSKAINSNRNTSTNVNANSNHNHTKIGDIGGSGSGGGVPGCQKAKNGC